MSFFWESRFFHNEYAGSGYTQGLLSLKQFIFNNGVHVPIIKPILGDSAGVFGAAALVA